MHRIRQTQHLVLVIGLGLAAVAGLLWWTNRYAPAAQASANSPVATSPAGLGSISASWTSTTPTSTIVTEEYKLWPIPEHGVTVTFPEDSIDSILTAVFTFTPQTGHANPPTQLSSYFFDLRGVYSGTSIQVSMYNEYDIALQYDPSELGDAEENSLRFYNLYEDEWQEQTTLVDTDKNTAYCTTKQTGQFALAGYGDQVFLPIVVRGY